MSGGWRWYFLNGGAASEIGADPADLSGARQVRDMGAERTVYYRDGFYFKLYRPRCRSVFSRVREYLAPRAGQEFSAILRLRRVNIPVVEPVAYGVCGTASMLITREEKNSRSVMEYLRIRLSRGEEIPEHFLLGWSRFLARFIASGLYLPDFNCGNLLYDEAADRFVMVDPFGLKRNLFNRFVRVLRMLKREFGVVFECVPKRLLVRMLAEFDASDPEKLYRRLMKFNSEYVRKSKLRRSKRLRQFRDGAAALAENGVRIKYSSCEIPFRLEGTEKITLPPDAATELWERDYILGLYHLPLLRVVARDEAGGGLYRQLSGPREVSAAEREDLFERLALAGFDRKEFDCCTNLAGMAVLRDCKFDAVADGGEA